MKLNNKQKATVASVLAIGVIGTQGYLLHNKSKDLENTESKLHKTTKVVKQQTEDLKSKDDLLKDVQSKYDKATSDIKDRDEKIKNLESENARLKEQSSECPTPVKAKETKAKSTGRGTPVTMTLSFYGDGDEENGGYGGITAYGESLRAGIVASNVHPRGTQFEYNGQIYTVGDKGGASHFNNPNRLDVFVPRQAGESKDAYDRRISNLGKQTVTMNKL